MPLMREKISISIDEEIQNILADKAEQLKASDHLLQDPQPLGAMLRTGLGEGRRLLIEDHNWIRLFEHSGDNAYSYRALLLARDIDLVAIGVRRCKAFEAYCATKLGLGRPEILVPSESTTQAPLTTRCIDDEDFLTAILDRSKPHGELTVLPYMGIESVWRLASLLVERSKLTVRVAAPLPHLTRCINDKSWFSRCVEAVLGLSAEPETIPVDSLAMLTHQIGNLSRRVSHVAIKLIDSASSAGNLVFDANAIARLASKPLREFLVSHLNRIGWPGNFPLLLTVWESPVSCTPSVHLWIPSVEEGQPVVEGIFDQNVIGDGAEYSGAAPTRLTRETRQRMANEALKLATVFQHLGYFGQCSLDAILIGENPATALLHWVECNGRWGGVSLPLALANRLGVDWREQGLVIVEEAHLQAKPCPLERVLEMLGDELYDHNSYRRGTIILSPGRLEEGSGYEIMVIDDTQVKAQQRAEHVVKKLTEFLVARSGRED